MKRSLPDADDAEKVTKYNCEESELEYDFKCFFKKEFDLMVYQVTCSDDPDPWTVIVSGFSDNGHLRFFAQLWRAGFPRNISDWKFCYKAWKELKLKGECNFKLIEDYSKDLNDLWFRKDFQTVFRERYGDVGVEVDGSKTNS